MKPESAKKELFFAPHFSYMSHRQCQKMHFAALEILERYGVRMYLEEAVDMMKKAGCDISEGNLVRIPSGLVERAFSTVPKRVVLADRNGRRVMPLEHSRTFFGPGSDCLNILDHRTNVRRKALLSDVAEGVILCDALPEIDFVMSMVMPSDVDMELADRYQMEIMLNNTTKPLVFVTYEFDGCVDAIEMAECVAGGEEALRRNPFLACYINVTTGFNHNEEALQKLLYLSGKGLPLLYIPDGNAGVTGPVTAPGAAAIVLAGTLAGLVLSQLNREGAPFIMAGWGGGTIDLKTMVIPYAYPTARNIMQAMARYYGLPSFGLGGSTDSKVVDQQAAAEAALTMLVEVLAGVDMLHDLGYLESGLTFSFPQLVICTEIISWIKNFLKAIDINEETLALDVIGEVGMSNDYLSHPHTFKHFRQHWYPKLFERGTYEGWVSSGGKNLAERAADKVEDILAQHQPERLPKDIQKALKEFVQRAESRKKARG